MSCCFASYICGLGSFSGSYHLPEVLLVLSSNLRRRTNTILCTVTIVDLTFYGLGETISGAIFCGLAIKGASKLETRTSAVFIKTGNESLQMSEFGSLRDKNSSNGRTKDCTGIAHMGSANHAYLTTTHKSHKPP